MAENKVRTKLRKQRVTLDDKYMGAEPIFASGQTLTAENRGSMWTKAAHWYNYYYNSKDYVPTVLQYAEDQLGYTKKEIQALKKLKDWELVGLIGKSVKLFYRGYEYNESELNRIKQDYKEKLAKAKTIVEEIKEEQASKPKPPTIQERMRQKMVDTVYVDWDHIVDGWMDGDFKRKIDVYKLFKQYQLKGAVLNMFRDQVMREYEPIVDAYNKTCDQAVEAYSHISKANQKKMIAVMDTVFEDLDKLKAAAKAARVPRTKKPKASDVQVKNLKYKVEDIDAKLMSINPVMIPGKEVLFVYNTKTRKLIQYKTNSTKGFEVSGTTIKNICESSRSATLRKPDDILPLILNKTIKQIDKQVWDTLTTKISVPNGRINVDCILLRAI